MLIVGSLALIHHNINPGRKKILDLDVIIREEELSLFEDYEVVYPLSFNRFWKVVYKDSVKGLMIECEIAKEGTTAKKLLDMLDNKAFETQYASPEICLAIKLSHRYLKDSPHFLKTMHDIHLLRNLGVALSDQSKEFLKEREKETYNYSHPKLSVDKKEFFNEDVFQGRKVYKYDHDSIHEAVKVGSKPAYTYFMDGPVKVSREKFESLPEDVKLHSVLEESYVLALERSIIPFDTNQDKAFATALMKVCTSIASGWWREYAWENYKEVLDLYRSYGHNLRNLLEEGLEKNIVKPFRIVEAA